MLQKKQQGLARAGALIAAIMLATSGVTAQTGGITVLPGAAQTRPTVLEGGTLIDGTGKAPIPDSVIVMEAGRIKAVGRRGQVQVPAGANVINVSGRTILPGLIDHHVHVQDWQFPMFLHYGVTTIADLNNDGAWIAAEREALKTGKMKGPRMLISGTFIWGMLNPRDGGTFDTLPVNTVDEARARVRALVADGVDIIKVDNGITDAQLKAIQEEADKAGLPALGHTQNIHAAAAVGFKHLEHMDSVARGIMDPDEKTPIRLYPGQGGVIKPPQITSEEAVDPKKFPALISFMVSHGVFVNPTILAVGWGPATFRGPQFEKAKEQMIKDPGLGFVPASAKKSWAAMSEPRAGYKNVQTFLKEYVAAGGKVVVGTDTGANGYVIPGLGVHNEMQLLNDAGIPNMQVLQGATLWNAQLLKKDKDLGSVEPGKLADIVVIDGNPLADISATQNVRMVFKEGQLMDTKYDPKWVNPIPQPASSAFRTGLRITTLSPRMARQGGQSVNITIEGTGFAPNALVRFDNSDLPTHFVSPTKMTATLDAKLLQRAPGGYTLYVVNTGPRGTVSPPAYFLVNLKQ